MANPIAQYTFLPWTRRGISAEIQDDDDLGAGTAGAVHRAALAIELAIEYVPVGGGVATAAPVVARRTELLGPGDVIGLASDAIIRTQPAAGERDVTPGHLAYVDLYDEDLPWRYTPARPAPAADPAEPHGRLRPWIALWVLTEDEFELLPERPGLPPAIRLVAAEVAHALPLHTETWAWSHVQISRDVSAADVDSAIRDAPDHALSRLVCPRRLAADVTYHAFVVPVFETGRLAGLGEDPSAVPAQAPSWRSGAVPHSTVRSYEYPTYCQWSFRTGHGGDFETLVRALKPGPVGPEFGKRALDIRAPGYGVAGTSASGTVELEGALVPVDMPRTVFPSSPGDQFAERLEGVLDLSADLERGAAIAVPHPFHVAGEDGAYPADVPDDPIVTPPSYGRRHAGVTRLADVTDEGVAAWLRELNLDPRSRVAAGLGAEIVQGRQEELVERAWQQVGQLASANQRLREAELALAVSESLFTKHVEHDDAERVLRLTSAAQRRITGTGAATVRAEIAASRVPIAAQTAAFKRITRPQRKLVRQLTGSGSVAGLHRDLVGRMNREVAPLSAAPPAPAPATSVNLASVAAATQASIAAYETDGGHPGHVFLEILAAEMRSQIGVDPGVNLSAISLTALRTSLRQRLDAVIPPTAPVPDLMRRDAIVQLIATILQLVHHQDTAIVDVIIPAPRFQADFGTSIAGKSFGGVVVKPSGGTGTGELARMTAGAELQRFGADLVGFQGLVEARPAPAPRSPLATVAALASRTLATLRPKTALCQRVAHAIPGLELPPADDPRRLRPIMAHPEFPDAMFEDLRAKFQDFIIPNYQDLPRDTLTLLEPNRRFIESFLAGLNEEMARGLLWREYPTDQRGTYFRTFWDTQDDLLGAHAAGDIRRMHEWSGALGAQAPSSARFLVLVIRGELLRKYPSTVVYGNRAAFGAGGPDAPRELASDADPANLRFPAFRGRLEPDISLFGFTLGADEARGNRSTDPGWFFVLQERPGEVTFGLDEASAGPQPPLASWNDLTWGHLDASDSIAIAGNPLVLAPDGDPSTPRAARWGGSAADQAYILLQNPVLYARHAEELLP